jgi:hypothetical protein
MALIRINSVPYASAGGIEPVNLLGNNTQRVWVRVVVIFNAGGVQIGHSPDGLFQSAILWTFTVVNEFFLRRNLGELITGEWWISDGAGGSPNATVTITEGILIPGS